MRELLARYGWKTVAGTCLFALGELLETRPGLTDIAALAKAAGAVLGGVGIRVAISNIGASS